MPAGTIRDSSGAREGRSHHGDAALCDRIHRIGDGGGIISKERERSQSMSKEASRSLAAELKPFIAPFRFDGSGKFHLKSQKTDEKGGLDKEEALKIRETNRKRLIDFQEKLYAQDRWSLLLIL